MATTNDIKNGSVLSIDGQLWSVIEFQHVKPGKGGAFVRSKLRNVRTQKVVDRTFNAGTKIDFETVDRRDYQYLYNDGTDFFFMDNDTFEQLQISADVVGDASRF
ncbi:MAG: elongation factor P, partial [Agrococcus casei]